MILCLSRTSGGFFCGIREGIEELGLKSRYYFLFIFVVAFKGDKSTWGNLKCVRTS